MRYQFDFDPANRIARCRITGEVDEGGFKKFYDDARKYVELTDPLAGLVDLSSVTSFQLSPQTIHDLAKLPPAMPDPARPRVVVAPTPLVFGMMRMFEMVGEKARPRFHVVSTELEAWSIFGVQEPRFEPFGEGWQPKP